MGYTKDTIKGVSWMGALRVALRSITFLRLIVLARILLPSQLGIFSIVTLILSLTEVLTETGINIFFIQQEETIDEYIDTAWLVSILRGIVIMLLIALSSPFVGYFFSMPGLTGFLLLSCIVPFVKGFINPAEVIFQKELQFQKSFWFRASIFSVESLSAILLAYLLHSVFALVIALMISALTEVILSFMLLKPWPRPKFDKKTLGMIMHNGKWVTASGIFNYLFQNVDNLTVGKLLGSTQLAFYNYAYNFSLLPLTEIASTISQVTFPVYTRIAADKQRLQSAYYKTTFAIALGIIPLGLVLFLFPDFIIHIVLGSRWLPASSALKVLAVFGVLQALWTPAVGLLYALKKQRLVTILTFIQFAVLALMIVPLTRSYGIVGASYSALIAVVVTLPIAASTVLYTFKKL